MDANVETSGTSSSSGHYKVIASAKNVQQEPVVLTGTMTTQHTVSEVLSRPGSPLLASPTKRPQQVADPDEGTSPKRTIVRTAHQPKSPKIAKPEKKKPAPVPEKSPPRKDKGKSEIQQYEDMDVDMLKFSSTDTSSSGQESQQGKSAPSARLGVHQSSSKRDETTSSLLKRILNPPVVSQDISDRIFYLTTRVLFQVPDSRAKKARDDSEKKEKTSKKSKDKHSHDKKDKHGGDKKGKGPGKGKKSRR